MSSVPVDPSASYATEVVRLLWPQPWGAPEVIRGRLRGGLPHRDAYLFPSRRRPRMLVPADVPGAAVMLRRLGSGRSWIHAPTRALLERAVHSPAFSLTGWPVLRVPPSTARAESIEHHLSGVFGTDVRIGVLLGTRRVNQKPVLQVFDSRGRVLGYAKIGHNSLTAGLVRSEAAALAAVGGRKPQSFQVPEVLRHDQWGGLEVLVLSSLVTDPRVGVTPAVRTTAMRELSRLTGVSDQTLGASGFWARLRDRALRLAGQPAGSRLGAAADALHGAYGEETLRFGAWHGDWGSWNMGMSRGVLQVWDWERFDPEVPLGFDAVHHDAQRVRPGEREVVRQESAFLRSVPQALADVGVAPGREQPTLHLYLMEISLRYAEALTHGATPALNRRAEWALSLLERELGSTSPASEEDRS